MKTTLRFVQKKLWLALFFALTMVAHAQLTPGDIAFVGINADASPNELAIVTLAPIASGQTIFITDYAWNGSALETTNSTAEGVITWTTNKTIPAGTIIRWTIALGGAVAGGLSDYGTVNATGWSGDAIASGGDNWFILQGSIASPSFIYAYANWATASFGVKTWPTSGVTFPNATVSYLPSSLTNGTTANNQSGDPSVHFDNNVYTGPKTGGKTQMLAALASSSNWTGSESVAPDLTPGGTNFPGTQPIFTVGSPAVITKDPVVSAICPNGTTTFTITATNATSYQWQVNTGSGFVNVSANAPYSGSTTSTLTISGASATLNNYLYRAIAFGAGSDTSASAKLTVKATSASSFSKTVCNSYVFNGKNITSSGAYKDTLVNKAGCDSVITLNLTVNKATAATISKTACNTYFFNGINIANSGAYKDTLVNKAGCDSVITLNLTVNKATAATISKTACNTYFFNGINIANSGVYKDTLVNKAGCDSVITLNLTLNKSTASSFSKTVCNSYVFNGKNITSSGAYKDTLVNKAGCDSVLTLNLTVNKATAATISKTACNTYFFNGINIANSGVYKDTLVNKAGCDSVITLNLTLNQTTTSSFAKTACFSYFFNGKSRTTSGLYKDTLVNKLGCDSIVTLDLIINKPDTTVTLSGKTLTAAATGTSFNWFNCTDFSLPLPNATGRSFTPTFSGSYAVAILSNGCKDTSGCHYVNVLITGIEEGSEQSSSFSVYPNPAREWIHLTLYDITNANLTLVDVTGQEAHRQTITKGETTISTSGLAAGVYMLKITAEGFSRSKSIVIVK